MQADLPQRIQMLYDRIKEFPEQSYAEDGVFLKHDAYLAFLDMRMLLEREVIPALDGLHPRTRQYPKPLRLGSDISVADYLAMHKAA